jgi:hypothetical protein
VAQNDLNVNILANVKGQEQIATLINRVGALEAETKKLQSANTALASSTDVVIRNGVRYNNAMDAQSRALRQNRQGTQQLGMQINDFATSVSSGTSVQQAFTQQLGQVGYAMSMMGGTAGKIGNFLAGPWGAMVLVGAMALGPLIQKLWDTYNAAGSAGDALTGLMKKNAEYMKQRFALQSAESDLNKLLSRRKQLEDTIAQKGKRDSKGNLMFVYAEQQALLEVNRLISEGRAARDAEKITRLGVPTLEEAMRPKAEKIKADKPSAGGSSTSKAEKEAERLAKEQAKIAEWVAEKNIAADKEWRDYWVQAEGDQMVALQEKLAFMGEMADATVQVTTDRLIKPTTDALAKLEESYKSIGVAVSDGFKGMITGASSWKDAMRGIINSVIDELWRLYVVQQIVGFVTKALGGIGLPVPGVAGARAEGGHVGGNKPYLVGERGPELFVPGKTGTIIPNKNMGGGNGGGGVTVNVDARGSADPAAVRAQVQQGILEAAPAIIAAAQAKTVAGLRRPRLGGAMK